MGVSFVSGSDVACYWRDKDASMHESSEPEVQPGPVPSDKSPQEFYEEITKREDVRAILEALATDEDDGQ
jgi:hypothetical protein